MPPTADRHPPVIRTLSHAEARALLERQHVGRIAYSFHDRVDIEPISYAVEGDWIYGRTSVGSKLLTLAHHPWCALEADRVRDSTDWESVVVKGQFVILHPDTGPQEDYDRALAVIQRAAPDAFSPRDPAPQRTILFRVHIEEMTGRAAGGATRA